MVGSSRVSASSSRMGFAGDGFQIQLRRSPTYSRVHLLMMAEFAVCPGQVCAPHTGAVSVLMCRLVVAPTGSHHTSPPSCVMLRRMRRRVYITAFCFSHTDTLAARTRAHARTHARTHAHTHIHTALTFERIYLFKNAIDSER